MSLKPLNPIVATLVENMNVDLREDFEERSAIMEYDGGIERTLAEALALLCILHNHPACLQPLVALEVELNGESRQLLTTALGEIRLRIESMGGVVVRVLDPVELIRAEFDEAVLLSAFSTAPL